MPTANGICSKPRKRPSSKIRRATLQGCLGGAGNPDPISWPRQQVNLVENAERHGLGQCTNNRSHRSGMAVGGWHGQPTVKHPTLRLTRPAICLFQLQDSGSLPVATRFSCLRLEIPCSVGASRFFIFVPSLAWHKQTGDRNLGDLRPRPMYRHGLTWSTGKYEQTRCRYRRQSPSEIKSPITLCLAGPRPRPS